MRNCLNSINSLQGKVLYSIRLDVAGVGTVLATSKQLFLVYNTKEETKEMNPKRDRYIVQALEFARRMSALADKGECESDDDGCLVLFGHMRDCAYKIKALAEHELEMHRMLRNEPIRKSSGKQSGPVGPDLFVRTGRRSGMDE